MPSNLATTFGSGDAVAAQWQYNVNNLVSWAQSNSIPTSRLTITESAITGSSLAATDPIPGSGTGAKFDPSWDNTYQAFYEMLNYYGIHCTAWAGGSEWRVDLRNFETSDGNNHLFDYRTTSSSILLNNLGSSTLRRGINMPGGEFSDQGPNGVLNKSHVSQPNAGYFYPLVSNVKLVTGQFGFNYLRIPFRMERVQPTLKQPLSTTELAYLDAIIEAAATNNAIVLLDAHQYARYDTVANGTSGGVYSIGQNAPNNHNGQAVGGTMADCFADFWTRMAQHIIAKGYTNVHYDISNEPHDLPGGVSDWQAGSRQIVEAIRLVDQNSVIAVEGYSYASVPAWTAVNGSTAWFTETIPSGQRNAGQARNTDPYLWFNGHCYPDPASNGYDGGFQDTYATELSYAQNQGFTPFTKPNYTFPVTGNTQQTGLRSAFKSTFVADDFSGTYDGIRTNSNTVTLGYTGDSTFATCLRVIASTTSDEGSVHKSLSGNTARDLSVDFKIPAGTDVTSLTNYAISHFWRNDDSTDLVEIAINKTSASTYNIGLRLPSGSYTFVNSGATACTPGSIYTCRLLVTDTALTLYLNGSTTAEATITGSFSGVNVGGVTRGKYYGTGYTGEFRFGNENDGSTVTAWAPPNGGYITQSSGGGGTTPPVTVKVNLGQYLLTI